MPECGRSLVRRADLDEPSVPQCAPISYRCLPKVFHRLTHTVHDDLRCGESQKVHCAPSDRRDSRKPLPTALRWQPSALSRRSGAPCGLVGAAGRVYGSSLMRPPRRPAAPRGAAAQQFLVKPPPSTSPLTLGAVAANRGDMGGSWPGRRAERARRRSADREQEGFT